MAKVTNLFFRWLTWLQSSSTTKWPNSLWQLCYSGFIHLVCSSWWLNWREAKPTMRNQAFPRHLVVKLTAHFNQTSLLWYVSELYLKTIQNTFPAKELLTDFVNLLTLKGLFSNHGSVFFKLFQVISNKPREFNLFYCIQSGNTHLLPP